MLMRRAAGVALVAVALIFGACGGDDDGGGGDGGSETLDVTARDFEFADTSPSVPAGEVEVQFTNEGEAEHSFTVEDLDVEVEAEGGESATTTFTAEAGTYEFHCEYHPDQMTGELTVE
jgi:plastocyanin